MLKKLAAQIAAGVFVLSLGSAGSAATLDVNGSGQLIGATGVNVGGTLYNVSFSQCSATVSGFTSACTPSFTNAADATLAAQALLDQVFIDSAAGMFDSNPALTLFCGGSTFCLMAVPYAGAPSVDAEGAFNTATSDDVSYVAWYYKGQPSFLPLNVAVFTPDVPEPATWTMMLLGFFGIAARLQARRLKRQLA